MADAQLAVESRIVPRIVPETAQVLLENAKALADGEAKRGDSLKQRAAWLLGFLGVVLAILLAQARSLTDMGRIGTPVSAALVLQALVVILDAKARAEDLVGG